MNIETIFDCEERYTASFCQTYKGPDFIRYADATMLDMYEYNKVVILTEDEHRYTKIIREEMELNRTENKDFCDIRLPKRVDESFLNKLPLLPEVTNYGYFAAFAEQLDSIKGNEACEIRKAESEEMIKDRTRVEQISYPGRERETFFERKGQHNEKAYMASEDVSAYICYKDGQPIGKADLFLYKNVAMIEDFDVIPTFQRKGYGTAVIGRLVQEALKKRAEVVFLTTDVDDMAKVLYQRLGFSYYPGRTQLFFSL